jgi:mannose-6-phosphate isomerase-like protein (cupin superfamily)
MFAPPVELSKHFNFPIANLIVVSNLTSTNNTNTGYPDVITRLPEAQVAFKGVRAWIMQGDCNQLVFFEFAEGIDLPDHNHTYPQWGMVIDGKMELRIDGKPRICQKGDEYCIPVGAMHGAKFLRHTRVMDFFSEKCRYKPK